MSHASGLAWAEGGRSIAAMAKRSYALTGVMAVLIAAAAALVATGAVLWVEQRPPASSLKLGGPFAFTDAATGKTVTDRSFRGKVMLIYFGYTYCPDACPTALNNIAQALVKLGPDANKVVPLFISIDPARDTPKVMATYTKAFDPRIQGLTGSAAETATAAKEFAVYYKRHDEPGGGYLMDHSSLIYVMGDDGKFIKVLPASENGNKLAGDIAQLLGSNS
jgi:protein SCO1/2